MSVTLLLMRKLLLISIVIVAAALVAQESGVFSLLKSTARVGPQNGFYLLPTEQLLRPWGEQAPIKGRPVDLTFDSKRRLLAVLNSSSVLLFDGTSGARMAEV